MAKRKWGLPAILKKSRKDYANLPPVAPGSKGPNYVARALRQGGYSEGGKINRRPKGLEQGQGFRQAGIAAAISNGFQNNRPKGAGLRNARTMGNRGN